MIELNRLEFVARKHYDQHSKRLMSVREPLKVVITNLPADYSEMRKVFDYPQDKSRSEFHLVRFTQVVYIDRCDFRQTDSSDFYGLSPNKEIFLKYAYNFTCCDVIIRDGQVVELRGTVDKKLVKRPKELLQWVSDGCSVVELREYESLFTIPNFNIPACKNLTFNEICEKIPTEKILRTVYSEAKLDSSVV
eukprot:TRINITY_DN5448_c0_g1_i1.p1 TRINITY_DN5448_c0_g1~~TRINITY_DN5448_c0_g1_i1.p1  ORF type:complete len:192 (-),score=9.28 TRINITY_DN5448_c0_g1_i1:99-674(-)